LFPSGRLWWILSINLRNTFARCGIDIATEIAFKLVFKFHDASRSITWDEVFCDSAYDDWTRNRFSRGGGKRFSSNPGIDLFLHETGPRFISPRDVSVIVTTFRIRLDRRVHHPR
jgi:hypothetical protein